MTISIKQIKAIMKPDEFKRFQKFMDGQTFEIGEHGESMIFENDFIRFIKGLPCID